MSGVSPAPAEAGSADRDWYAERGVDHAHCPDGCEHPQPVVLEDGRLVCRRCLTFGETVDMEPCDC